ncbi:hypothetical protein ACLB2K_015363 [Fragaria x ananassa]
MFSQHTQSINQSTNLSQTDVTVETFESSRNPNVLSAPRFRSRSPSGLVSNFPIVALLALTVSIDRQVIQKSKLGNISSSGDAGALIRLVKKSGRAPFSFLIREVARPAHTSFTFVPSLPFAEDVGQNNIRDAVSLGRTSSIPPPLCSLCQHKTPVFGKPPKQLSYQELEEATDAFSDVNFLAEGGFGVVHRGVLRDGQVVAVKQLKFGGSQADADFCREVRVLSCAQHRNVVLLIGYCIEGKSRLLVYEYICNSSLDFHLHGVAGNRTPLDYESRLKIATGTARGLRYLHEDCRVGCIVHRDLRPNNILLTHDFEPLVADFGLARWHSEWETNVEDRCIGTSGYLAPEYIDSGQITHKVDVYAFGVVLLELMTGRRIGELHYVRGHQFLEEWLHRLATLEPNHISPISYHLLDPNMASESPDFPYQLQAMARAASLCLQRDPDFRPSMSKLIRVLEGGDPVVPIGLDLNTAGSRSGHLPGASSQKQPKPRGNHSRKLSH